MAPRAPPGARTPVSRDRNTIPTATAGFSASGLCWFTEKAPVKHAGLGRAPWACPWEGESLLCGLQEGGAGCWQRASRGTGRVRSRQDSRAHRLPGGATAPQPTPWLLCAEGAEGTKAQFPQPLRCLQLGRLRGQAPRLLPPGHEEQVRWSVCGGRACVPRVGLGKEAAMNTICSHRWAWGACLEVDRAP